MQPKSLYFLSESFRAADHTSLGSKSQGPSDYSGRERWKV